MAETSAGVADACLLALGYANVDVIASVARLPGDGDRITASGIEVHPGGMAANCACAAAQLGTPTYLLASVGRGGLAEVLLDDLGRRGVGTEHLHRGEATTIAVITVTPDGQRSIISEPVNYDPEAVDAAIDTVEAKRKLFYVDGYHLGWATPQLERAKRAGFTIYADLDGAPDTYAPNDIVPALRLLDVVQWNEDVSEAMLPDLAADDRQAWLAQYAPAIVTTRSTGNVEVAVPGTVELVPVAKVSDVIDTTGAGDIFAGAVLHGLARGESLSAAVARAVRVAGESVRHAGARLPLGFTGA